MNGRLEGKVALITGTGGGQGRAASILFAKEGAKIIGCDVKVEGNQETMKMVRDAGGEMITMEPLDLTSAEQIKKLIDLADKTYGKIDILYNNASRVKFAPVATMPREDWDFTIENELNLIFTMVQAALPLLKKSKAGSIINTGSLAGIRAIAGLGNAAHAATKGGVIALTRQLALELAPDGIRANSINPGLIQTPATSFLFEDPKMKPALDGLIMKVPLGRAGQPEDIAKVALFLASDDSAYITGAELVVDGGSSIW